MNKIIKILAFIILILGLVFVGYQLFKKDEKKEETEVIKAEEQKDKKAKKKEATLPVKVLEIKKGHLPLRLRISATADVWEKATLKSEVSGKVRKIYFKVGDWVKKGQLLVKIDDVEKKLEVDSKKAFKLQTLSKFLVKEDIGGYNNPNLTEEQKNDEKLIAGCVGGALLKEDYLRIILEAGFKYNIIEEDTDISNRQYNGINLESLKVELYKTNTYFLASIII